jgi:hypothetical protein
MNCDNADEWRHSELESLPAVPSTAALHLGLGDEWPILSAYKYPLNEHLHLDAALLELSYMARRVPRAGGDVGEWPELLGPQC